MFTWHIKFQFLVRMNDYAKGYKREAPILGVRTLASELTSYLAKMTSAHC